MVKLTRMQVDSIRANTMAFVKQHGDSSTELMPMLPKRLLIMCDTIDELYDAQKELVGLSCDLTQIAIKGLDDDPDYDDDGNLRAGVDNA